MKKTLVVFIIMAISQATFAKLDIKSTKPLTIPLKNDLDQKITSKDVEKIVPLDIPAGSDMNTVASKIADKGIQSWFNSAQVQASVHGQTANKVQKKMATDITVKASEQPNAVEHKVSMQLMALQTMARLQYSGLLNAVVNYDVRAAQSMVELSDKVFNKDLFVNHSSSSKEDVSSVGVRWGW